MKKNNILIIDDDSGAQSTLSDILEDDGYAVTTFGTGQEALDYFKKSLCSVIILDIKLPDMSGMEVLEQIKLIDPESAVIMMTGHASIDTAVDAMKVGAYAYITKPIDINELKTIIKTQNETINKLANNIRNFDVVGPHVPLKVTMGAIGIAKEITNDAVENAKKEAEKLREERRIYVAGLGGAAEDVIVLP